jgi:ketosteroid isomerase-like protein
MLPFLQPPVIGTEAVRANYESTFQLIRFEMQTTIQELVEMSPEWAYVRTDTSGIFTPTRTGEGAPSAFHELFLLRKAGDDRRQIARYSFSPAGALPLV